MKAVRFLVAAGIALAASSANAGLTNYDFDGFAAGTDIAGIDLGGAILDGGLVSGGVVSGSGMVSGAFSQFGIINVSVDLSASDSGDVFLNAYAPGDYLINSIVAAGGSISVFAPNTVSVSFGAMNGGAFSFDNLAVDSVDVLGGSGPGGTDIPLPAALPLMSTALAGMVYLGARRKRK